MEDDKAKNIYEGPYPTLLIADPELIKAVFVKDFHYFSAQRNFRFGNRILDRGVFMQTGERWKQLRSMMSPSFTSGKLRLLYKITNPMQRCSFTSLLFRFSSTFTIDVIARTAFGIKLDSRKDPNNPFVKAARRSLGPVSWRFALADHNFMCVIKNFYIYYTEFDLDDVVSQCVMFFVGGYFAPTLTISCSVHELAVNPDIQEKLINEVDETIKKSVTYFINIRRIERRVVEDHELGDTGIVVEKGTMIGVPVYALNHDPKYFPDPDKFDPERFLSHKNNMLPFTNLSFGIGPRNCIAKRFALMEVKMALAKTLQYLRFKPGINTKKEPELLLARGFNRLKHVYLKIELRK
ncbi:cytochrome P450 3A9-like [Centruroides sculpturatus]|uniref:cytochrome P450 3A9-like n=1 Tax=Centruroides sculpturatus TaxID=218467 RepID=UPI000C6EAE9D|nr:cytochrome P450 3A9-like [Centruroides sculpturatus]